MSEFPYLREVYNSCENQHNPYDFTPNSCGYFNDNYSLNDLNFEPQNFQNDDQASNLENSISSLLEIATQQNQMINKLCNSYLCDNSNQSFQNNQNLDSLLNSNDFEYNPCQFNFEIQNEFQNQDENVIHFSNNFGNGNNLDNNTNEKIGYQQIQNENFQINNHEFDFVDQMENDNGDLLLEKYKKIRENHNQISTCEESNNNLPFIKIDNSCFNESKSKIFKLIITNLTLLSK